MENTFNYNEFITRNIGFVTEKEQEILRKTRVFIPGVGGMGGAAVACLARAGVEHFIIADIDHFDVSNMNRQIFSSMEVVGKAKAAVTKKTLESINPGIQVEIKDGNWVSELDEILKRTDLVINGCDDMAATIQLMRKCREYKISAIDAFASPLPSVYVIRPDSERPEEAFGFPTVNIAFEKISPEMIRTCVLKEIEHVAVHSSSLNYVDRKIAGEIMNGTRKRISFAPMVWMTGCLMSYEAVRLVLKKAGGPGVNGMFYNPWTCKVERPKPKLSSSIRRFFVRRFMGKL